MCGIWGYVASENPVDASRAWDGLCALTDRGPDDWGMYFGGVGKVTCEDDLPSGQQSIAIGNRRLSILDISAAGNQPMRTDDGQWIVYNGEVYNYRELRDELRGLGYTFESDTDTEVVLKAYQEFGPDCVDRFRGMFAFAIYDEERGTVFAARDRFGIKPFYYVDGDDSFAFASEVTSLLSGGVVDPELNHRAVDGFLTFGYVPCPETILDGVRALPPGSTLRYDEATDDLGISQYDADISGTGAEPSPERLRELLAESVELRLRSDVPVGTFLSGGLDSSAVTALVREAMPEDSDIRTYSIGFEEGEYSEADIAERVASLLGTDHTTESVSGADVREELDAIFDAMDQPTIDGVNSYFVSKVASEDGMKVTLSGLGSDELLYGYPTFASVSGYHRWIRPFHRIPGPLRTVIARTIERAGRHVSGQPTDKLADTAGAGSAFGASYLLSRGLFPEPARRRLTTDIVPVSDWSEEIGDSTASADAGLTTMERTSDAEARWYMGNQLLRDTDAMSMAHSLEVRVPFLDAELAAYARSVGPPESETHEKELLKDAVRDLLPAEVLDREKSGFVFPFDEWLRDDLDDVLEDTLADGDALESVGLNSDTVAAVRRSFQEGEAHWTRVWGLVVLVKWVRHHLRT
jgi:asparagine synthase (glutamine-hydrolysing)